MVIPMDRASKFVIGDWHATPTRNLLERGGDSVRIEPRAMEVLVYLADHAGAVISADELIRTLWQGRATDDSVYQAIKQLRRALGDDRRDVRYIQTIPKRGYRLIAEVAAATPQPGDGDDLGGNDPAGAARREARHFGWRVGGVGRQKLGYAIVALVVLLLLVTLNGRQTPDDTNVFAGLVDVSEPVPGFSDRAAIAVLPFTNLSGDPDEDYFSDGMTEELALELGSVNIFPIIGVTSTFSYKGSSKSAREIAAELGAGYLLDGSLRRTEGQILVTARLVDANGRQVWGSNFDSKLDDIFAVQAEITQQIVGKLAPELLQDEIDLALRVPTGDMEAWDYYLQALAHATTWGGGFEDRYGQPVTRERTELAEELVIRAIDLDESFGRAHTLLGHINVTYSRLLRNTSGVTDELADRKLDDAFKQIQRGYSLDRLGAITCSCYVSFLAWTGADKHLNLREALTIQEGAVKANRSNAFAHTVLAQVYQIHERYEDALYEIGIAKRLSPKERSFSFFLTVEANTQMNSGDFTRAVDSAEVAIGLGSLNANAHATRMLSLFALEDRERATLAKRDLLEAIPHFSVSMIWNIPLQDKLKPVVVPLQTTQPITRYRQAIEAVLDDLP